MREYRARQKAYTIDTESGEMWMNDTTYMARIADLEAEVARLKRELAARPDPSERFDLQPLRAVPKRPAR